MPLVGFDWYEITLRVPFATNNGQTGRGLSHPDEARSTMVGSTPSSFDDAVFQLFHVLGVAPRDACWLEFTTPGGFAPEIAQCHINVWAHWKRNPGGSVVTGWVIWQAKAARFIEAEFHSVWCDPTGVLLDVTPRKDGERFVLFVRDVRREITLFELLGQPAIRTFANVRLSEGKVLAGIVPIARVLTSDLLRSEGLVPT